MIEMSAGRVVEYTAYGFDIPVWALAVIALAALAALAFWWRRDRRG